ncbi:MAG: enoyl-CoA hydratase/isomerase family protein [Deltaproteobacteria bacterium]|nr:enoyl-CoA hydratase/isomerase family protein [Deltaproteobacteria bacterium]
MSDRPYTTILVARCEDLHGPGVLSVTLNRPGKRNAIGPRMVNELLYALGDAGRDEQVRSVVLTGAGEAFCAGGDLAQLGGESDEGELPPQGDYADLLLAMVRSPKPIVARVNGHALGGGLGLVAASHFAVGALDAKLGTPEIKVGLFPMMIMAVLRRVMPHRQMLRMMLLGERMSAEQAVACGLLGRAVPAAELDQAVAEVVGAIAKMSPVIVRLGLEALADQEDLALAEALPLLRERLGRCLATDDTREGLMAFLKKREPVWTGR